MESNQPGPGAHDLGTVVFEVEGASYTLEDVLLFAEATDRGAPFERAVRD